ncbi:hypothetical protein DFJ73DRAFT_961169 [Zopfochytrium polystomum]|nr:hypothetical protein DFJ73DRAFT_961169 [Zopfochytrium polystomum]
MLKNWAKSQPVAADEAAAGAAAARRFFTPDRVAHLHEHGYVLIPGVVADPAFCQSLRDALFAQVAHWDPSLTPASPSRWKSDTLPAGTIHGIDRLWPHTQALWDARQHPNVAACFAEYWDCDPRDLVVSFDGSNTYVGTREEREEGVGVGGSRKRKSSGSAAAGFWAHSDQGRPDPKKNRGAEPLDGKCLQGFLNLVDCDGDNDGGLVVWRGGHRAWRGYLAAHPEEEAKGNWLKYPVEYIEEIQVDGRKYLGDKDPAKSADKPFPMPRVRVRAKAGDMVFWYSKTPHQNDFPALRNPAAPAGRDRAVIYVCMCPRRFLTEQDTTKRVKAFAENRMTSHWPAGGQVKLFPASFRAYTKERAAEQKRKLEEIRSSERATAPVRLTPLGKRLLGFQPPEGRVV